MSVTPTLGNRDRQHRQNKEYADLQFVSHGQERQLHPNPPEHLQVLGTLQS